MVNFEVVLQLALLLLEISMLFLMIFIFGSYLISSAAGAPYVPMYRNHIKKILNFGGLTKDDTFYDLGCGDGRVLICAARDFSVRKSFGFEISPWPYWKAKFSVVLKKLEDKIEISKEDIKNVNLANADFVYMYLFPKLVNKLASKIGHEVRVGTKIVSASFQIDIKDHPAFELIKSEKIGKIMVYLYERV